METFNPLQCYTAAEVGKLMHSNERNQQIEKGRKLNMKDKTKETTVLKIETELMSELEFMIVFTPNFSTDTAPDYVQIATSILSLAYSTVPNDQKQRFVNDMVKDITSGETKETRAITQWQA